MRLTDDQSKGVAENNAYHGEAEHSLAAYSVRFRDVVSASLKCSMSYAHTHDAIRQCEHKTYASNQR